MSEVLQLPVAFMAGLLLGLLFFRGLWATVHGLDTAPHPARRMLGSSLLRFALVLAAFYCLSRYGGWQDLLAAVPGFTLARIIVIHRMVPRPGANGSDA